LNAQLAEPHQACVALTYGQSIVGACQAALAAEPEAAGEPVGNAVSDAKNFDADALWQKGGFA